jgi:hypothetical protein
MESLAERDLHDPNEWKNLLQCEEDTDKTLVCAAAAKVLGSFGLKVTALEAIPPTTPLSMQEAVSTSEALTRIITTQNHDTDTEEDSEEEQEPTQQRQKRQKTHPSPQPTPQPPSQNPNHLESETMNEALPTAPIAAAPASASVDDGQAAALDLPPRSALRWRLGEVNIAACAVSSILYEAAVASKSLIVYSESEFAEIEKQLQATVGSVQREGRRASSLGLEWKKATSKPNGGRQLEVNQMSPAIYAGLQAGKLTFTREERDGSDDSTVHSLNEYDYVEIEGTFYKAMAPSAQKLPVAWHRTDWTPDHLQHKLNFRVLDTPSITCVFHSPKDDEGSWYELLHVFVPPGSLEVPELHAASEAFAAAAATRFEVTIDEGNGQAHSRRCHPKNLRGEWACLERGAKVTEGPLLMHGVHRFHGVHVEGRASEWVQRYNPTGEGAEKSEVHRAAIEKTNEHCRALQKLEETLLPEAAQTRHQIATTLDPAAEFRVIRDDPACTPFSMGIGSGYVVECHNDSGCALEGILFQYSSEEPMPEGHAWMFVAAGCLHKLPAKRSEGAAYMAVRGSDASHGTLPTSSTMPHLTTHAGVSTTIITKKQVVDVLSKRLAEGALPFPSQAELDAARIERRAVSNAVPTEPATSTDGEEATVQVEEVEEEDTDSDSTSDEDEGESEESESEIEESAPTTVLVSSNAPAPGGWKESMLKKLQSEEIQATKLEDAPKSIRKLCSADSVIIGTTPSMYEALRISQSNKIRAGMMLQELMRRVSACNVTIKHHLTLPGGSTQYSWFVLSADGMKELAEAARTSAADLDTHIGNRGFQQMINRAVQKELAEQGLHCCTTCTMPVLDTDDPQYEQKAALIQEVGRRGVALKACGCGMAHVVAA